MKHLKTLKFVLLITLFAAALPVAALAQPAVSVECAYTTLPARTSSAKSGWMHQKPCAVGGCKVTYDPGILSYVSASKDDAWIFTSDGEQPPIPIWRRKSMRLPEQSSSSSVC